MLFWCGLLDHLMRHLIISVQLHGMCQCFRELLFWVYFESHSGIDIVREEMLYPVLGHAERSYYSLVVMPGLGS